MNALKIIEFLLKFDKSCVSICDPVNEVELEKFEQNYKVALPTDYKELLLQTNGFGLLGVEVFGLGYANPNSLQNVYEYERKLSDNRMPNSIIPFSPDGAGNHYCFDTMTTNSNSCNIIFWESGYEYSKFESPEITHNSFSAWIDDIVIKWTVDHYDFSGNDLQ